MTTSGSGTKRPSSGSTFSSPLKVFKKDKNDENPNSFQSLRRVYNETTPWKGKVNTKLESAAPFNFFLTRVKDSPATYNEDLSITFQELLDPSLGEIQHTIHVNFMVDLCWLLAQYAIVGLINPPMTILYGVDDPDLDRPKPHLKITPVRIKTPSIFGHHHTKMSIFFYKDNSTRFIISTANLIESDWENRTQGVWISPRCPALPDDEPINSGESETLFKCDIINYLNSYHQPCLRPWLLRLQRTDMSAVRVFLIASIPVDDAGAKYGISKLSRILRENAPSTDTRDWQIVAQCSSIGSLGPSPTSWLTGVFGRSLEEKPSPRPSNVHLIYPSVANVKDSLDGMLGGACLPYSSNPHHKQTWLKSHLRQWKSGPRHRTGAVPHIKTYTKISPDNKSIAWFVMTSANLSKAAWGMPSRNLSTRILSYELGVLFLPKLLTKEDVFTVKQNGEFEPKNNFPLPYQLPLLPYEENDQIFLYDKCFP